MAIFKLGNAIKLESRLTWIFGNEDFYYMVFKIRIELVALH